MDLRGRTAIVTGASRGIGKQAAIELGRRGANVVVAARTVEPRRRLPGTIAETVDAVRAVGATALAVPADMAVAEDLDRLVASTVEEFGGFDVLVNNAATASGAPSWAAPLVDLSRDDWMAQFAVNLHAPFTLTKLAVPIMRDRGGGRVINVTSGSIEVPAPDGSGPTRDAETTTADDATASSLASAPPLAYFSSKAALDRFCAIVAPQLEDMNISIVNLHPGAVRTEFVDILASQGIPTDHFIPMDVPARALAFIASCDDPMQFTGRVVPAEWLVERYNL